MRKHVTNETKENESGEFSNTPVRNTDFTCKELVEVVGEPLSKGITDGFNK